MRQRRLKDLDERLEIYKEYFVNEPEGNKGEWNRIFEERTGNPPTKIFLEVGIGKGKFIGENAGQNTEYAYIGVEGQPSVSVSATEKICKSNLENVLFVNGYLLDATDWFEENEIDGVFLNFSDPWPKKRHEKRRLNHRNYLTEYKKVIKDGGFIKIKTDNDDLFTFGIEEAKAVGMEIAEITEDLHASKYMVGNIKTEYEEKFTKKGIKINYLKINITKR